MVPGLAAEDACALAVPALVFRSGAADAHHPRVDLRAGRGRLGAARLVEPPWGDREWPERQDERTRGVTGGLFVRWHLLVPQLHAWADEVLDRRARLDRALPVMVVPVRGGRAGRWRCYRWGSPARSRPVKRSSTWGASKTR